MAVAAEPHGHWGYIWGRLQWQRRYIWISPGKLQVFSNEEKHTLKKNVLLRDCTVKIVDCRDKSLNETKHFWELHSKTSESLTGFIVSVKVLWRNDLFMLAGSQDEAESWKDEIECAAARQMPQTSILARVILKLLSEKRLTQGVQSSSQQKAVLCQSSNWPQEPELDSLRNCTEFLKSQVSDNYAFKVADCMVDHFNSSFQMGDSALPNELRIEAWRATLLRIVKTLRDGVLADNKKLENSEQLWVACETWVMSAVYDKIMGASRQMFCAKDKQIHMMLPKLAHVDSSLLGVPEEVKNSRTFTTAIQKFEALNSYKTPLEKAVCLRSSVNCVLDGIRRDGVCTDDLLSLMLLLMARSKIRHLTANACFMEHFFCLHEDVHRGELGYHITNFLAACKHLDSREVSSLVDHSQENALA